MPLPLLLTQNEPTIWNSAYRLPVLCLVSSHLPLSLSIFFFPSNFRSSSLSNRKNAHLITAPAAKAAEPAPWDAPLSFRKDLSPRVEITPCHLPWGSPPRPLPLCLPLGQNFFPAASPCVSRTPVSNVQPGSERAFCQLPGIRASFGWAAILIASSLFCFQKKKKKLGRGMEILFSPGSLPPWGGAREVMGPCV